MTERKMKRIDVTWVVPFVGLRQKFPYSFI
jgi:hypothetical protein